MSGAVQALIGSLRAGDPNWSSVTLLLPGNGTNGAQNNTFIDSSANAFSITRNGNTTQGTFSPFTAAAPYSAARKGGSGYFDGTGDYLSVPDSAAFDLNSTFTLECWIYQPAAGDAAFISRGGFSGTAPSPPWSTTNGYQFLLFIQTGTLYWQFNTSGSPTSISATAPAAGAWHHLAIGYNGTTTRFWLDGASLGTSTAAYTLPTTRNVTYVGIANNLGGAMSGYISNLRIVKGTDVYGVGNSTITVPTAPLTAITNTSLLLNFTNAGIIDNAMLNDLETRGNAQISAAQSKFGGSSMAFDGTDDRLVTAASPNNALGSGDFTVEAWVWSADVSSASQRGWIQTSDVAGGLKTTSTVGIWIHFGATSNGTVSANVGGTAYTSAASTVAVNTWYHIALTRASGVVTIWVNGTSVASGSGNTTNLTGQNLVVGGYYSTAFLLNGYIDDLRITKGVARYTANFTPPAAAFPTS